MTSRLQYIHYFCLNTFFLKKLLHSLLSFFLVITAFGQQRPYFQQKTAYQINVSLNDIDQSLDGNLKLNYQNNSQDTLRFIWFHLWPNAYKNDRTAFSDQLLENGSTKFYFSTEDQRGYINRLAFKIDGVVAESEDHPQHQDIIKLLLNRPLLPGGSVNVETPFHVKLPYNFSRGGHVGNSYQLSQWYPKPAVYDTDGWHEMPYLDQGEFYSEYGSFKVDITVPRAYKVAATGILSDSLVSGSSKTLEYYQDSVHDFAWFADKDFLTIHDTMTINNQLISINIYHYAKDSNIWSQASSMVKKAILSKSLWVGRYPYKVVSVVENARNNAGGGMEYPTITIIENTNSTAELETLINHEVGHNWFYGILGNNERLHPWMDEGMNSYYDQRYVSEYGIGNPEDKSNTPTFFKARMPQDVEQLVLATIIGIRKDQPIETSSEVFSNNNYSTIAYTKTANWMKLIENKLGQSIFDSCMHVYFNNWKFRHPSPQNFKHSLEQTSGRNLDTEFALLIKKGPLVAAQKKDIRLAAFFSFKETFRHHYISIAPAAGYNFYDKLMIGAFIHNYSLPLSKFIFFAAPLYATGSKNINGLGRAAYNWYGSKGQKLEVSAAFTKFSGDSFKDSTGHTRYQSFRKIVPSFKYVFANARARATVTKYIQWKTYFIQKTGLLFNRDTINNVDLITYPRVNKIINQLKFGMENTRVLYPYDASLQVDQGNRFIRAGVTANYFFNYVNGGGMKVRFFAGKFFYTGVKTYLTSFETDPYHLTLSGPAGYEDYTYSNYFYGRNEFEGAAGQQIMIRDGAFKVRTDLLNAKLGKTDDWLTAVNFTTDIPNQVNPFRVLPFKLPIKIFLDAGTYAEAWQKSKATGRFLFDAGLQLSLFKNSINVYFPLLYSKVYKDYFKSYIYEKRFSKNISFSFDFQNLTLKKLFPQFNF